MQSKSIISKIKTKKNILRKFTNKKIMLQKCLLIEDLKQTEIQYLIQLIIKKILLKSSKHLPQSTNKKTRIMMMKKFI